jgi:hypothetical protein
LPSRTGLLNANGAVIDLHVGVDDSRQALLLRNGFAIPASVRVPVQIDTGTAYSGFALEVFRRLDIRPFERVAIRTPSTAEQPHFSDRYVISLAFDENGAELLAPSLRVIECFFAPDEGILGMLGRDVLDRCRFIYDGRANTFSLEA